MARCLRHGKGDDGCDARESEKSMAVLLVHVIERRGIKVQRGSVVSNSQVQVVLLVVGSGQREMDCGKGKQAMHEEDVVKSFSRHIVNPNVLDRGVVDQCLVRRSSVVVHQLKILTDGVGHDLKLQLLRRNSPTCLRVRR